MTVHFQELKHGLDSYNPKTWRHFKDSNHDYSPLIKSMVANGDIIEINKKIAIKAEKLEKDVLIVGWKFYDKFQELFDIALETIEQYETLNYSKTGNQYKIKKDITGRSYRNYYLGILFNETLLKKELESLEGERDLGLNFRHHGGSGKECYNMTINTKNDNTFESQLFSITTIIRSYLIKDGKTYSSQGSGFYYNQVSPSDPNKSGPQWYRVDKFWLVTNRHVVLTEIDGVEYIPDRFDFFIRENINGLIQWKPISLTRAQLLSSLKLHKQNEIDVALVEISPYIQEIIDEISGKPEIQNIYLPSALSNTNLPENQPLSIDVTSDIIVASYPQGFYDKLNKFPIVKSGIIASAWGYNFNGLPIFQIDAQLFPGSSGGLVISKPTNIAMIDGNLKYNKIKQFVFLGVYSGEFKWYENIDIGGNIIRMGNSYGLGNVWYSYLIPEIISDGVKFHPSYL